VLTTITNHATASHLQSHPFFVSCTFYTSPFYAFINSENFYLLVILLTTRRNSTVISTRCSPLSARLDEL